MTTFVLIMMLAVAIAEIICLTCWLVKARLPRLEGQKGRLRHGPAWARWLMSAMMYLLPLMLATDAGARLIEGSWQTALATTLLFGVITGIMLWSLREMLLWGVVWNDQELVWRDPRSGLHRCVWQDVVGCEPVDVRTRAGLKLGGATLLYCGADYLVVNHTRAGEDFLCRVTEMRGELPLMRRPSVTFIGFSYKLRRGA